MGHTVTISVQTNTFEEWHRAWDQMNDLASEIGVRYPSISVSSYDTDDPDEEQKIDLLKESLGIAVDEPTYTPKFLCPDDDMVPRGPDFNPQEHAEMKIFGALLRCNMTETQATEVLNVIKKTGIVFK